MTVLYEHIDNATFKIATSYYAGIAIPNALNLYCRFI